MPKAATEIAIAESLRVIAEIPPEFRLTAGEAIGVPSQQNRG
ncbi:hypothetical protein [Aurantiacibacter poecillastricola]|nr:hypothetical protein [Aurantiacibacter sp. 219JJ12-13]MDP5262061.1 hypothetical protein [Aurantiacibacter sp. 219JJ12-13]